MDLEKGDRKQVRMILKKIGIDETALKDMDVANELNPLIKEKLKQNVVSKAEVKLLKKGRRTLKNRWGNFNFFAKTTFSRACWKVQHCCTSDKDVWRGGFFLMLALLRRASFWPLSMAYISVINYSCYKLQFFFMI